MRTIVYDYDFKSGYTTKIGLISSERILGKSFEFTKRIKYLFPCSRTGVKATKPDIYFEIKFNYIENSKGASWFSPKKIQKEKILWVPEANFSFDFSDESEEVIIECA